MNTEQTRIPLHKALTLSKSLHEVIELHLADSSFDMNHALRYLESVQIQVAAIIDSLDAISEVMGFQVEGDRCFKVKSPESN